ncbi:unnamed protein product [Lymnaea stagnalis]|uniref:C-type lectin domain-containing protein n=1 Tax=Lymnaea stagnalis TaxID=6523 RepID=A0AAV2IC41_LYMST
MLQFRKQNQFQMLFTLLYISLNFLTPTKGLPCKVTKNSGTLETLTIISFNNKCYLFGKEKVSYDNAYYFCSRNEGVLTDVVVGFGTLIEQALNESSTLEADYWIGLFWTSIWSEYIWASGANYNKLEAFKSDLVGKCVKFSSSSKTFENVRCGLDYAPICMFSDINDNETSRCSNVCKAVQGKYGQTTTALTTTLITPNSSLETTTSPLTWTTTEGNTTSKNCNYCTECDCDKGHEAATKTPYIGQEASLPSTTPLAVLAALLTASLLANAIAFVMFWRLRCKNRTDETHKPISMVDILSVDSSSLNQAHTNQETRDGYDIYTDPESPGYQDVEPKMSVARNITSDVSKGASVEIDSQPYSQLDREGAQKLTKASEEGSVYGPESFMAATSKSNQDSGIALKQDNSGDALNLYSIYDSSL